MNSQTLQPPPQSFIRDKFDVLLIAMLFLLTFAAFVSGLGGENLTIWLKDICQAFLYALLALVGVRVRSAPSIGPAATESGDININQPAPAETQDPAKSNNENKNDI